MEIKNVDLEEIVSDLSTTSPEKKRVTYTRELDFEILLKDRVDFVIKRKTKTLDKIFAFLFSANNFYIYNETKGKLEELNFKSLNSFFNGCTEDISLESGNSFDFSRSKAECVRLIWFLICLSKNTLDLESVKDSFPYLKEGDHASKYEAIENIEKYSSETEYLKKELISFPNYMSVFERETMGSYTYYRSTDTIETIRHSQKLALLIKQNVERFFNGSMTSLATIARMLYQNYDLNAVKSFFEKVRTA
jgi:hypothetical protein